MRRIVKRDELRKAEITIVLNEADDVIGVEIALFEPVSLVDFNFEKLFLPAFLLQQSRMMSGGSPRPA